MLSEEFAHPITARADALGVTVEVGGVELVDSLEPLWLSLFEHHRAVMQVPLPVIDRGETWGRRRSVYLHHLATDEGFIYLVRRGGKPVGYAMVYLRPGYDDTWVSGARIAEVESLAVLPEERGHGLGTLLLDAVEDRLARTGVDDLRLSVVVGNDESLAFYRKRGMVPTLTIMGARGLKAATQAQPEMELPGAAEATSVLGMMDEQTLRRFVSKEGRILTIPTKHIKRLAFLAWLVQDFEEGVRYPETEVNRTLLRRHEDCAALRRYLVEMGFMARDGGSYWRTDPATWPTSAS